MMNESDYNIITHGYFIMMRQSSSSSANISANISQVQDAKTFRERTVFILGDEASASKLYFEISAAIRRIEECENNTEAAGDPMNVDGGGGGVPPPTGSDPSPRASSRWADATVMLKEIGLQQYGSNFVEEERTSIALLEVSI